MVSFIGQVLNPVGTRSYASWRWKDLPVRHHPVTGEWDIPKGSQRFACHLRPVPSDRWSQVWHISQMAEHRWQLRFKAVCRRMPFDANRRAVSVLSWGASQQTQDEEGLFICSMKAAEPPDPPRSSIWFARRIMASSSSMPICSPRRS